MTAEEAREKFMNEMMNDPDSLNNFQQMAELARHRIIEHFSTADIDYENMPITDKVYSGWLLNYILPTEGGINGRWPYWLDIMQTQEVEGKDIPQIHFHTKLDEGYKLVSDMLEACLSPDVARNFGMGMEITTMFVDWLLYGFGALAESPQNLPDRLNRYWYQNFKGDLMIMYPADYFVDIISNLYSGFNANQFYPTPKHIVEMMVEMEFSQNSKEKNKYESVVDPCVGSGSMLLVASNHSLRLFGQDIDPFMTKVAKINGYLYMPWSVNSTPGVSALLERMNKKYNE